MTSALSAHYLHLVPQSMFKVYLTIMIDMIIQSFLPLMLVIILNLEDLQQKCTL